MTSKPVSKETLGLVKAALAEPTPEDAARKLALVKRLESDVDFRHAIEKRNQVAEEAQQELPGLGAARAEALLRRVDATGEGAEAHDTLRDVAGAPASKETRDALEKSRTQPGLQPALKQVAPADAAADGTDEPPAAEEWTPAVAPEERGTSRWLIWLGLLALVAMGVVIWIVVGRLTTTENAGAPSAKPVDTAARAQTTTANTTLTSVDPVRTVDPVKTADPMSTVQPSSTPSGPRPTATTSTASTSQTPNPSALPHQTSSAPFKWNWP